MYMCIYLVKTKWVNNKFRVLWRSPVFQKQACGAYLQFSVGFDHLAKFQIIHCRDNSLYPFVVKYSRHTLVNKVLLQWHECLCGPFLVEKELNFGDHGYARRNPLPGLEEEEADGTSEEQHPCSQCQLLKKQLEQEVQHTARLQREVGRQAGRQAATFSYDKLKQGHASFITSCPWQAEEMKKRLYRLDRVEKGLQNFLYEDQIRALSLTKRSRRAVWSPETILKAQKIRSAVGTKGYEYLRELGYPLPSYRTLCNRLETKIMVTTDMSCAMLAELGLGLMAPCDSPSGGVEDHEEEELMGVLSWRLVAAVWRQLTHKPGCTSSSLWVGTLARRVDSLQPPPGCNPQASGGRPELLCREAAHWLRGCDTQDGVGL